MQYDADEREDSNRSAETAAQYCSRYTNAAAHTGTVQAAAEGGCECRDNLISFKSSCHQLSTAGSFYRYCWLYAKVIRVDGDDALIHIMSPTHRRYYNFLETEAQLKLPPLAVSRISLKAMQPRVLFSAEQMLPVLTRGNYYDYSYHPAAAPFVPEVKRRCISRPQPVTAAMVLMLPKQQSADVNIDFDCVFAFESEPSSDCNPNFNFYDGEGVTAPDVDILSLLCGEDDDAMSTDDDDDLTLAAATHDEHCNSWDEGDDDDKCI
jgi:hypothetical protein